MFIICLTIQNYSAVVDKSLNKQQSNKPKKKKNQIRFTIWCWLTGNQYISHPNRFVKSDTIHIIINLLSNKALLQYPCVTTTSNQFYFFCLSLHDSDEFEVLNFRVHKSIQKSSSKSLRQSSNKVPQIDLNANKA